MRNTAYLALRYMLFHKLKTALLVVSLMLILFLPIALQMLSRITEERLMARAVSTPLALGARGSSLDLVIESLYFEGKALRPMRWGDYGQLRSNGDWGSAVPLYTRFRAREHMIVGTTLQYFDLRGLRVAQGRNLQQLGECVLGAEVARKFGLKPGDSLLSTPESLFDIAGVYPLKMRVAGVLAPAHTQDDRAVFVDIKTAWVIEGLGHGHDDLAEVDDPEMVLEQTDRAITASPKLVTFTEITPENIASFHFHGDRADFPISAVLCFPDSRKSEDILRGRYQDNERLQMVKPELEIENLNATLFRIRRIMNAGIGLVGAATGLLVLLVFLLSIRLRQSEIQTLYKLGCARGTVAGLLGAELAMIGGAALSGALGLAFLSGLWAERLVQVLLA